MNQQLRNKIFNVLLDAWHRNSSADEGLKMIEDALGDAEAEPVAWMRPIDINRTMIAVPEERAEVSAVAQGEFTDPVYRHPPSIPEGYALVPIEPTPEMFRAASATEQDCAIHNYGGTPEAEEYWSVMLSAALNSKGDV